MATAAGIWDPSLHLQWGHFQWAFPSQCLNTRAILKQTSLWKTWYSSEGRLWMKNFPTALPNLSQPTQHSRMLPPISFPFPLHSGWHLYCSLMATPIFPNLLPISLTGISLSRILACLILSLCLQKRVLRLK